MLKRAVQSVLNQTYNNIEIIIVDDGSTDDTFLYLEELMSQHENVIVFRNLESLGACSSRNIAINNAKGRYITGLDDDDEFVSNRLQVLFDSYEDKYAFICTNFVDRYTKKDSISEDMPSDVVRVFNDLKIYNSAASQVFTETNKLKAIGGFDSRVKRLQDWDTWFRLSLKFGSFLKLKDPLYIMHHEHEIPRVSGSYSFSDALSDFYLKHSENYSTSEKVYFTAQIKFMKREFKYRDFISSYKIIGIPRAIKWLVYSLVLDKR